MERLWYLEDDILLSYKKETLVVNTKLFYLFILLKHFVVTVEICCKYIIFMPFYVFVFSGKRGVSLYPSLLLLPFLWYVKFSEH